MWYFHFPIRSKRPNSASPPSPHYAIAARAHWEAAALMIYPEWWVCTGSSLRQNCFSHLVYTLRTAEKWATLPQPHPVNSDSSHYSVFAPRNHATAALDLSWVSHSQLQTSSQGTSIQKFVLYALLVLCFAAENHPKGLLCMSKMLSSGWEMKVHSGDN